MIRFLVFALLSLLLVTIPATIANQQHAPDPSITGSGTNCDQLCGAGNRVTINGTSLTEDGVITLTTDPFNTPGLYCASVEWTGDSKAVCVIPTNWPIAWIGQMLWICYTNTLGENCANTEVAFGPLVGLSSSTGGAVAPIINYFNGCESNICYRGDQLMISGQYLNTVSDVQISIYSGQSSSYYSLSFNVENDNLIVCWMPNFPGDWANNWLYVTVITPYGKTEQNALFQLGIKGSSTGGGGSLSVPFISSVSGCNGDTRNCQAGQQITVTGDYFTYATQVSIYPHNSNQFEPVQCYDVYIGSDSQIVCYLPDVDSSWFNQWIDVTVTNDRGKSNGLAQIQFNNVNANSMSLGAWIAIGAGSLITLMLVIYFSRYCCKKSIFTPATLVISPSAADINDPLLVADSHHHHRISVASPVCDASGNIIPMPGPAYVTHCPTHVHPVTNMPPSVHSNECAAVAPVIYYSHAY